MRNLRWLVIFALAGACDDDDVDDLGNDNDNDGIPNDVDDNDNTPPGTVNEWRANLVSTGDNELSGVATVRQPEGEQAFFASLTLRNDFVDAERPWHVHFGTCETGGGIVGDPAAYPPLRSGDDGSATSSTLIRVGLDLEAEYHVNVHESDVDLGTIIACGDLARE